MFIKMYNKSKSNTSNQIEVLLQLLVRAIAWQKQSLGFHVAPDEGLEVTVVHPRDGEVSVFRTQCVLAYPKFQQFAHFRCLVNIEGLPEILYGFALSLIPTEDGLILDVMPFLINEAADHAIKLMRFENGEKLWRDQLEHALLKALKLAFYHHTADTLHP